MPHKNFGWFVLLLVFLASCNTDKSKNIPDVSGISLDWQLVRYDQEMLSLDSADSRVEAEPLFMKYPVFSELYFRDILGLRTSNDSLPIVAGELLAQKEFRHWIDTCSQVFQHFDAQKNAFDQALRLLKYHFPEKQTPRLYTLVSEFSISNFIFQDIDGRDALGIGLDFFLGPDFTYTAMAKDFPAFSYYLSRSFTPDHMCRKTMAVVVEDMTPAYPPANLLDAMIQEGKKMYVLEHLVPFVHDTVLWEFPPEQMSWVQENEGAIWRHFIQEDLLYSTDRTLIQKLTLASPNSPGMPLEAPGRAASYTGYRIIQAYHRRTPDATLEDILRLTDAQQVLTTARYKP